MGEHDDALWRRLLSAGPRLAAAPLPEWFAALQREVSGRATVDAALLGGHLAPTPGHAFLAGYEAALRVLWPAAPAELGALCVTEAGSVRPADLQVRVVDDGDASTITGRKDFVTAGDDARWWLVAARDEADGERPRLALVVVRAGAPGARVEPLPPIPWLPEVGHARLHLEVTPCERLPGDGWDRHVKPFRTVEDLHVLAAIVAWLHHVGLECAWPEPLLLRLAGVLAGAREVGRAPADAATTHVLLAGLFAAVHALEGPIDAALAAGPAEWAELWARERRILGVASGPRAIRLERALTGLGRRSPAAS